MSQNSIKKSSTYRKDRVETKFDTLDIAKNLKRRVAQYVMNEKKVPKKWRYFEGKPAVDYARKIRDCISRANDIELDDENPDTEKLKERAQYQAYALSYCNILQLQIDDIIEECNGATHENMAPIVDELTSLVKMITRWQQSDEARIKQAEQ